MTRRHNNKRSWLLLLALLLVTFMSQHAEAFWWSSNKKDANKEEAFASKEETEEEQPPQITLTTENARYAAAQGLVDELKHHLKEQDVHSADENGWGALHEAARGGHLDAVRTLLDHGADVHARTGKQQDGGSVLYWAKHFLGQNHAVVAYLQELGAIDIGPEL